MKEKQLALEQSRSVLESVGAERLGLITSLQSEVEAGRVREGQMAEMREKLATLEQLLCSLQDEVRDGSFLFENSSLLHPLSPPPTLSLLPSLSLSSSYTHSSPSLFPPPLSPVSLLPLTLTHSPPPFLLLSPQLECSQQQNRELEDAHQAAETLTTQTETQLMAERREREEEKREREERAWEVTRQLQELKELHVQTQTKV